MLTIDIGTKAYLAGVIDFAGHIRVITVRRATPTVLPRVELLSKNVKIMAMLAGLTEVKVFPAYRTRTSPVTPPTYRWELSGSKATVFLANIRPYLYFHTSEADEALLVGLAAPWRPSIPMKMRRLGWDIPPELIRAKDANEPGSKGPTPT